MKYKHTLIIILLYLVSCQPFGDCKEYAEDCKEDECLLIVEKIPTDKYHVFDYEGINLVTKEKCDCDSDTSDRWWDDYNEYIEIGDTLIKRKGELTFNIHKKDTVLSFNFECQGKVYK